MEIRNLITFLKASEEGSFSRAAVALGYAQSTVTMQIKQLEEELDVRLFDRIGKTVVITPKGEELRSIALVIIRAAEEASHLGDADSEITDSLRIGVTESLQDRYMPDLIHDYYLQNPKSAMVVKAASISTLIEMLHHSQLDLVFICNERIRSPYLTTAWEKKEPVYFVSSPDHPLQKKKDLSLDDILAATFLQTETDSSYGLGLSRYLADRGYTLSSYLHIENPEVILQLLKQNDGISFLPEYVLHRDLANGSLKVLPYDTSDIDMWIQLLHHKSKFVTAAMKSFIQIMDKYFSKDK